MNKKLILVAAVILIIVGGLFVARTFLFPRELGGREVVSHVNIFVIADGTDGEKIGCDDNLIPYEVSRTVPTSPSHHLEVAIQALLTTKPMGDRQMNNLFYGSGLQVSNAYVGENGTAIIELSGNLSLGGVCDTPRIQNQLEKTALAVPGVSSVEIFINSVPLAEVLSQK